MSFDQLQPKPRPGEFTGPVNVNELNRILRRLQQENNDLRVALAKVVQTEAPSTVAGAPVSTVVVDDTLDWVL